ncbi:MAG: hypothetical protein AAGC83_04350 [Pseudomonadota bacterium]
MTKTAGLAVVLSIAFAAPAFAQCIGGYHSNDVAKSTVATEKEEIVVAQSTSPLLLPLTDGETETDASAKQ